MFQDADKKMISKLSNWMDEAAKKLCFLRQDDPSEMGNEEYTNLEMAKMELIDFNNKMFFVFYFTFLERR